MTDDGTLSLEGGTLNEPSQLELNLSYPWTKYANEIQKIIIQDEIILPETARLFVGLNQLKEIENPE